ncbi:MAG: 50S ribosomal protein L1 [Mycoplasmoidaceae bacterium]
MKKLMKNKKTIYTHDKNKVFSILEAVEIVKNSKTAKFNASIDIAIKLNLDTSKAEQQLRGTIALPHYFGKKQRIIVIDDESSAKELSEFKLLKVGGSDLISEISNGWLDFDLIITTPKMMPQLSKLGKILGPKGLMPNPKIGNVTNNVKKIVENFQKGVSHYRTDSYGNIHMLVGKMDSDDQKIIDNINALVTFLKSKKPSTVKGIYIQNISISSTMGPGVKVAI